MAWLHTWSGLVVGWVLFFVFVTGTAGYFNSEITRWMQPELPLHQPGPQDNGKLATIAMDRLPGGCTRCRVLEYHAATPFTSLPALGGFFHQLGNHAQGGA